MIAKVLAKSIKAIALDRKLQVLRQLEVSGNLHRISQALGLAVAQWEYCGNKSII